MKKRILTSSWLIFFLALGLLGACAKPASHLRYPSADADDGAISRELVEIPQDLKFFAQKLGAERKALGREEGKGLKESQEKLSAQYMDKFFRPWDQEKSSLKKEDISWPELKDPSKAFAENLRPYTAREWLEISKNRDIDTFPSLGRHALTIGNTPLRAMPTDRPYFKNPDLAGEGYPFDYFQNSTLWPGTPVLISHASQDGLWVYAESARVSGWAKVKDLCFVDKKTEKTWRNYPKAVVIKDSVILENELAKGKINPKRGYALKAPLGSIFPQVGKNSVYFPHGDSKGSFIPMRYTPKDGEMDRFPLAFSPLKVAELGNEMMGQAYGWGGYLDNRDCSAMILDLFTPFGLWLPRNSAQQAKAGISIDLKSLEPEEKENIILEQGLPFASLVYMPGHITLYVGEFAGKPVIFHNAWGVRTKNPDGSFGRAVIGKAAITTLRVGAEHENISSPASLLDRVEKLVLLPLVD